MDISFLKSNRFWALIIGALVYYGKMKGFIGDAEMVLLETILGGFIAVKTTDRAAEQIGGNTETGNGVDSQ